MTLHQDERGNGKPDRTPVRLSEIAAHAGVSEATVSRVLNDRPGVAPPTRQAVLAALDILGVDRAARNRPRTAGLVGLITPELDDPIIPSYAQVIERLLALHGYTPVLCTKMPGGAIEDDFVALLTEHGADGIVFVSGQHGELAVSPERYVKLIERGVPAVFINGYLEGVPAPFFSVDDRNAMGLVVRHLVSLGHTRLGLADGPARLSRVARKVDGFLAGVAAAGGTVHGAVSHSISSFEGGQAAGELLLDQDCTAIACGNDMMALGVIRSARARGLRVPDDIAVVGFDDSPLIAYTDPPLTTVRQPVSSLASVAVSALVEMIAGWPSPPGEFLFLPELVVRGSTGSLAGQTIEI
ncbi:MAG TPA: LacI family DNA-binding transcriptional regulator [Micromonosporaceae bacterium]|jgi:DNA-binding LacI/PurR family transcriptional regulator